MVAAPSSFGIDVGYVTREKLTPLWRQARANRDAPSSTTLGFSGDGSAEPAAEASRLMSSCRLLAQPGLDPVMGRFRRISRLMRLRHP